MTALFIANGNVLDVHTLTLQAGHSVLVEDGREVGRIPGYAGEEAFWGLLAGLTKNLSRTP